MVVALPWYLCISSDVAHLGTAGCARTACLHFAHEEIPAPNGHVTYRSAHVVLSSALAHSDRDNLCMRVASARFKARPKHLHCSRCMRGRVIHVAFAAALELKAPLSSQSDERATD